MVFAFRKVSLFFFFLAIIKIVKLVVYKGHSRFMKIKYYHLHIEGDLSFFFLRNLLLFFSHLVMTDSFRPCGL